MSLDNVVCPECESEDIREEKNHNLFNLSFGLAIGVPVIAVIGPVGFALGPTFYFKDIPFGADKEYYCNECDYHLDAD